MEALGRRGGAFKGPKGPSTHRCQVGLCRQGRHGALRRVPRPRKVGNQGGFRGLNCAPPHRPPTHPHAHPRLYFWAARGGRLSPTRSAPASSMLTGSDVPAKLSTTQAEATRPQRGRRRKSRATRGPGPAQSLVQSNRLLPQSLLGNTATATQPGTSKGAVLGISVEDSKYPRKGLTRSDSASQETLAVLTDICHSRECHGYLVDKARRVAKCPTMCKTTTPHGLPHPSPAE